jgi:hypothetical protein
MIISKSEAKEIVLEAVITRADGSIERLGSIAYWNINPLKNLWWKIKTFIKGL